jgi:ABC-type phosphate transport system substrate-binding protein
MSKLLPVVVASIFALAASSSFAETALAAEKDSKGSGLIGLGGSSTVQNAGKKKAKGIGSSEPNSAPSKSVGEGKMNMKPAAKSSQDHNKTTKDATR